MKKIQLTLQEKGEEIIVDLRAQAADAPSREEVAELIINRFGEQ